MKDLFALFKALRAPPRPGALPAQAGDAWLFAASSQAVLILESGSNIVVEANPAAAAQLGLSREGLIGRTLIAAVAGDSAAVLSQALAAAALGASGTPLQIHSKHDGRALTLTLSMVRSGGDSYLLGQLIGADAARSAGSANGEVQSIVLDAIEQAPEGFVLTDLALYVSYANRAFVEMAALDSVEDLQGKSLAHWLELSQADLARLGAQLANREAVSVWNTSFRSSSFRSRLVEVSAVAVPDGTDACWGFSVRAPMTGAPTAPI